MANVTDSNSWRTDSLSDAQGHVQRLGPHIVSIDSTSTESRQIDEASPGVQEPGIPELSMVLRHLFDGQRDQILWNFTDDLLNDQAQREQSLGLEAVPGFDPVAVDRIAATDADDRASYKPWLVIVAQARDLGSPDRVGQLQMMLSHAPRILVVVCDAEDAIPPVPHDAAERDSWLTSGANALGLAYVGPIKARDSRHLLEALLNIKQLGHRSLLHLRISAPDNPSVEPRVASVHEAPGTPGSGSFRITASRALSERAASDARVVAVSTTLDADFSQPWESVPRRLFAVESGVPHALTWCANLAATGSRPFVFLSLDELQNSFGQIRQNICLKRAPVTLLVESRGELSEAGAAATNPLGAIRQFPNTSIVSPKDASELCEMLAWCASQDVPVVIWLPESAEPTVVFDFSPAIKSGQCEQLRTGADVAIIAWGPLTAAACSAADCLARYGIAATVINARFAQPLDIDGILRAVRGAACAVLVDDSPRHDGFGGWVLELLARRGIAQSLSIVSPDADPHRQSPQDRYDHCAMTIVERCRWLSAPISANVTIEPAVTARIDGQGPCTADGWLNFFGARAGSMAREREQVYTQQLSSTIQRWVSAYETVGSRDLYLWKWCLHGVELTTLACVPLEFRAHVCETKLLSIVLCVLLDDVADQHGNSRLLDALLEMTCAGVCPALPDLSPLERRHAELTCALWAEYQERISSYPCYEAFEPVLRYDLLQFFNTMRYSHLVNGRPYLLNMVEHDLYTSHNMMMISFAMLDLMCSPGFPKADVGTLREAMWHAQCMGRIGNLLSTWRRELADRDFTSGVFARARIEGDLTLDDLEHGDFASIEATIRGRGHELYFFRKWAEHREQCHARARQLRSFDPRSVLDGHDRFFAMHLGSQGLI